VIDNLHRDAAGPGLAEWAGGIAAPYYLAGQGWDPCTGWGSIDGTQLLTALASLMYPQAFYFQVNKSTFGPDEVKDNLSQATGLSTYDNAFSIVLEGFKVKLPTAHIEQEAARKVYDECRIPIATAAERVRHVVDCAFSRRRIVIFSGGAAVFDDDKLLDEIRAIQAGGGFGSIIGRNSFQRRKEEALRIADWRRKSSLRGCIVVYHLRTRQSVKERL
jgi:hypothetical protein